MSCLSQPFFFFSHSRLFILLSDVTHRNEKVADLLIDAYPQAVGEVNNAAGTPLHLACCETNASPIIVGNIIETQAALGIPFNIFDNNGE